MLLFRGAPRLESGFAGSARPWFLASCGDPSSWYLPAGTPTSSKPLSFDESRWRSGPWGRIASPTTGVAAPAPCGLAKLGAVAKAWERACRHCHSWRGHMLRHPDRRGPRWWHTVHALQADGPVGIAHPRRAWPRAQRLAFEVCVDGAVFDRALDRVGWVRSRDECVAWCTYSFRPAPLVRMYMIKAWPLLKPGPGLRRIAPAKTNADYQKSQD